ncbi:hypothetical protein BBJ28_00002830 [Nothophytophthora sp. Chile5]|nr:hypothetical protein BBJ28_00002830 [Nothophytophthora sp. Chile5]
MEVLLLATTEKEGEDNLLYHYEQTASASGSGTDVFSSRGPSGAGPTTWQDLRGVLAAAVGATTSLCGESLRSAHFGRDAAGGPTGVASFVDLYEVLYVLVFPATDLPTAIIQYYTRSSCDLLLGFFGYPDAKLSNWRRQTKGLSGVSTLTAQLDAVFRAIFAIIERGKTETENSSASMGLIAIWAPSSLNAFSFASFVSIELVLTVTCFCPFSKRLVCSAMRSDFLRLLFQWLLESNPSFTPDASVTKQHTRFDTYELFDSRFTRHGEYPKRHAFLIATHGEFQLAFLTERALRLEGKHEAATWTNSLADDVALPLVEALAEFCAVNLERYLETTRLLRHRRMQSLLTQHCDPESLDGASSRFLWYGVALDRLRGVIIGDELATMDDTNHRQQTEMGEHHAAILACFVDRLAALQQSSEPVVDTQSPDQPSGIPPLKLDIDDRDALFLHEQSAAETGADLSAEDTHIFPRSSGSQQPEKERKRRRLQQMAERVVVRGQTLWIVANYYETLEFFAVLNASLPLELLEHEINRLCAFGGAESTESPSVET